MRASRLQETDALVKCLAFDAITAWRVCCLDRYARDAPDTPAAEVLTEDERQVIGAVVRAEGRLPPAERGKPFLHALHAEQRDMLAAWIPTG